MAEEVSVVEPGRHARASDAALLRAPPSSLTYSPGEDAHGSRGALAGECPGSRPRLHVAACLLRSRDFLHVTGAWDEGQVSLGDAELAGQPREPEASALARPAPAAPPWPGDAGMRLPERTVRPHKGDTPLPRQFPLCAGCREDLTSEKHT